MIIHTVGNIPVIAVIPEALSSELLVGICIGKLFRKCWRNIRNFSCKYLKYLDLRIIRYAGSGFDDLFIDELQWSDDFLRNCIKIYCRLPLEFLRFKKCLFAGLK